MSLLHYFVIDCSRSNNSQGSVSVLTIVGFGRRKNSTKTVEFIFTDSGNLERLYLKNSLYCKFSKNQYIPLVPQPDTANIVKMKRYYAVSAKSNFKRRITWFENIPGQLQEISKIKVFEYLGEWPGSSVHVNTKNTAQPYKNFTRYISPIFCLFFGRAIHSLSKIGEELYIEPLEHGLALRTVNSSRSAYACFQFSPTFFQHYDDGAKETSSQESEEDAVRCKIAMKSCLTVFKSMSTVEKTVERCQITLNMQRARLVFKLHCKHGIVKTHNLAFIECETLQAVFSKDMCPNQLTAQPKLLCDAVVNFQSNQEEITLIVCPEKICLKNYVDDESDPTKVMHTVLNLDPNEFDNCQVGVDTEITFCLKEFRAILAFAEVTAMPINIKFETSGRPVVISIDADSAYEANFVLATLADSQTQLGSSATQHQSKSSSKMKQHPRKETSNLRAASYSNNKSNYSSHQNGYRPPERNDPIEDDFEDEIRVPNISKTSRLENVADDESHSFYRGESVFARHSNQASPQPSTSNSYISPVIPNQNRHEQSMTEDVSVQEEEEDDGMIPGTPPKKKFRSMFFGLSQASSAYSQSQTVKNRPLEEVLVQDTDEEDD